MLNVIQFTLALASAIAAMTILRLVIRLLRRPALPKWLGSEGPASALALALTAAASATIALLSISLSQVGFTVWTAFPAALVLHFTAYLAAWKLIPLASPGFGGGAPDLGISAATPFTVGVDC